MRFTPDKMMGMARIVIPIMDLLENCFIISHSW